MGCSQVLAGPHEQGIGIIGTMGIGPDATYAPYDNAALMLDAVPVARATTGSETAGRCHILH